MHNHNVLLGMWNSMYVGSVLAQMDEGDRPSEKESKPFVPLNQVKGDVHIYGRIQSQPDFYTVLFGGVYTSPDRVLAQLNEAGSDVRLLVNSPGGEFMAGSAIRSMLLQHKERGGTLTALVEGMDASASTLITQTADRVTMTDTSTMMIHSIRKVLGPDILDATGLERKAAALMDDARFARSQNRTMAHIYAERSGGKPADFLEMLERDTFLSATEAIDKGLADDIFGS